MFKRAIAVSVLALLGAGLIAVPAQAAGEYFVLTCSAGTPANQVRIQGGLRNEAGVAIPPLAGTYRIWISLNGGAFQESVAGLSGMEVTNTNKNIPALTAGEPGYVTVKVTGPGTGDPECTYTYDPLLETPGVSGVTTVDAGKTSTVLTTVSAYAVAGTSLTATLEILRDGTWVPVEVVPVIPGRNLALVQFEPTSREPARFAYHRVGPGLNRLLGTSSEFEFDVRYRTPVVTAPSSLVQSKAGVVSARFGTSYTTGSAVLQRRTTAGAWQDILTADVVDGEVQFSLKTSSTATYRVGVTPTGGAQALSSTFAVTYLPAVSIKAPASVKKNANATFTVTHRLAKLGSGHLQVKSGSTWKTVKTFTLKSAGVTSTSVKVTKAGTYRVKVGSYTSSSAAVKVK